MTADPITDELGATDGGTPGTHNRARQLADALTWLRLALVMPIAVALLLAAPGLALAIYLIAATTDYLDGRLARASGTPSGFGAQLDPLADKLLVLMVLGVLWAQGLLDAMAVIAFVVILAREIAVTGLRIVRSASHRSFSASRLAKAKTFVQMSAVGVLLGAEAIPAAAEVLRPLGAILLLTAALLALCSAFGYLSARADANRSADVP